MENMEIWDKVKRPPSTALKTINAGRLRGKSDISPQWRYQVLTEVLGPCGIGWKYEIKRLWTEPGSHDQVMAFSEVLLWVKVDGQWSEPIPGIGGAALIAKESSGLHSNDEGYKMAVTDALSVALKMIGVAADIYAGLWDGSKYKETEKKPEINVKEILSNIAKTNSKEELEKIWIAAKDTCQQAGDSKSYNEIKKVVVLTLKKFEKPKETDDIQQ